MDEGNLAALPIPDEARFGGRRCSVLYEACCCLLGHPGPPSPHGGQSVGVPRPITQLQWRSFLKANFFQFSFQFVQWVVGQKARGPRVMRGDGKSMLHPFTPARSTLVWPCGLDTRRLAARQNKSRLPSTTRAWTAAYSQYFCEPSGLR